MPFVVEAKTWFIDIGNSTTQYVSLLDSGGFSSLVALETKRLDFALIQELFAGSKCVVSTVVPSTIPLFESLTSTTVHFVTPKDVKLIEVMLSNPSELGADRLVNAVAAYKIYGGPCLILDSGTALTCCYVDETGRYLGGAIFPGMHICSKSLNEKTAKLPLVWVEPTQSLYGQCTKEAIQIGLYEGFLGVLKHFIDRYRQQVPGIKVVGTGQGLSVFLEQLDLDVYDELLIFKGLQLCGQGLE